MGKTKGIDLEREWAVWLVPLSSLQLQTEAPPPSAINSNTSATNNSSSSNPSSSPQSTSTPPLLSVNAASSSLVSLRSSTAVELDRWRTIPDFWRFYNNLHFVVEHAPGFGIVMLRSPLAPAANDAEQLHGAVAVLPIDANPGAVSRAWLELALSAIGETFDVDHMTGVGMSVSQDCLNVQVWLSGVHLLERTDAVLHMSRAILQLPSTAPIRILLHNHGDEGKLAIPPVHTGAVSFASKSTPASASSSSSSASNAAKKCRYERDFLKRMALSDSCKRMPPRLQQMNFDELKLKSGIISSPSGNRRFSWPSIRFDQADVPHLSVSDGMNPNLLHVNRAVEYSAPGSRLGVNVKSGHIGGGASISLSSSNSPNVVSRALDGSNVDNQPPPQTRQVRSGSSASAAPPAPGGLYGWNHDDRDQLWGSLGLKALNNASPPQSNLSVNSTSASAPPPPPALTATLSSSSSNSSTVSALSSSSSLLSDGQVTSVASLDANSPSGMSLRKPKPIDLSEDDEERPRHRVDVNSLSSTSSAALSSTSISSSSRGLSGDLSRQMPQQLTRLSSSEAVVWLPQLVEHFLLEVREAANISVQLQQTLAFEGCPGCGNQEFLNVDAAADARRGPYLVLTCRYLLCQHVMHLQCAFSQQLAQQAPTIDSLHATNECRVIRQPQNKLPSPFPAASDVTTGRIFNVEFGVTHFISNAYLAHQVWQSSGSLIDDRQKREFLFLQVNSAAGDSSVGSTGDSALSFRVRRGKFVIAMRLLNDRNSNSNEIGKVSAFSANFDLSAVSDQDRNIRLISVDQQCAINVGMNIDKTAANDVLFTVSFIRFEMAMPHSVLFAAPIISIATSIIPEESPRGFGSLMSPMSTTAASAAAVVLGGQTHSESEKLSQAQSMTVNLGPHTSAALAASGGALTDSAHASSSAATGMSNSAFNYGQFSNVLSAGVSELNHSVHRNGPSSSLPALQTGESGLPHEFGLRSIAEDAAAAGFNLNSLDPQSPSNLLGVSPSPSPMAASGGSFSLMMHQQHQHQHVNSQPHINSSALANHSHSDAIMQQIGSNSLQAQAAAHDQQILQQQLSSLHLGNLSTQTTLPSVTPSHTHSHTHSASASHQSNTWPTQAFHAAMAAQAQQQSPQQTAAAQAGRLQLQQPQFQQSPLRTSSPQVVESLKQRGIIMQNSAAMMASSPSPNPHLSKQPTPDRRDSNSSNDDDDDDLLARRIDSRRASLLEDVFERPRSPSFQHENSQVPLLQLSLEQVVGNVVRLAKTHPGSRFLQAKLDAHDALFFKVIFEEMLDHLAELMIDNFSHFSVEKLISLCDDQQIYLVLQKLAPQVSMVSMQKHGSFSIQALVDACRTTPAMNFLVETIRTDVLRIICHNSGHFVILRMLQKFPAAITKFIDEAVAAQCAAVGQDHHGLRVMKALLTIRKANELSKIFKAIARLAMKLVENQYGNYTVQHALDVAPPNIRTSIKAKMEGKFMRLSKQKFSSNVIEKCLKSSSAHWRNVIIHELIQQPSVAELLRDRYGNYVLQTALAVANANQVLDITKSITPYLGTLRENVRSKWKKMLKRAASAPVQSNSPSPSRPPSPPPSNHGSLRTGSTTASPNISEPNSRAASPMPLMTSIGLGELKEAAAVAMLAQTPPSAAHANAQYNLNMAMPAAHHHHSPHPSLSFAGGSNTPSRPQSSSLGSGQHPHPASFGGSINMNMMNANMSGPNSGGASLGHLNPASSPIGMQQQHSFGSVGGGFSPNLSLHSAQPNGPSATCGPSIHMQNYSMNSMPTHGFQSMSQSHMQQLHPSMSSSNNSFSASPAPMPLNQYPSHANAHLQQLNNPNGSPNRSPAIHLQHQAAFHSLQHVTDLANM